MKLSDIFGVLVERRLGQFSDPYAPATGWQIRQIAIQIGGAVTKDRNKRLRLLSDLVGRELRTSRELTVAEAAVFLSLFESSELFRAHLKENYHDELL